MNTSKQQNSLGLSEGNKNSGKNEVRIEVIRKVTELLDICLINEKYHVCLWNGAITKGFDTQEEAMEMIEKKDVDMIITAMWAVGTVLMNEANNKANEKIG